MPSFGRSAVFPNGEPRLNDELFAVLLFVAPNNEVFACETGAVMLEAKGLALRPVGVGLGLLNKENPD